MTDPDALSTGMLLAGALMAFTPLVIGGIVLTVWWRGRKRTGAPASGAGAAREQG